MGKLSVFNFASLNGFYKDVNNGIGWHRHEGEEVQFSVDSLSAENILLFGRVTYDMMASFWPTQQAIENLPQVADGLSKAEKIVFSNTLKTAGWGNTRVMNGDIAAKIKALKQTSAKDLTILGSGSILTQFAEAGLIDTYQFMIDPVALGDGGTMFRGIKHTLNLKMISHRTFNTGTVLLTYHPL